MGNLIGSVLVFVFAVVFCFGGAVDIKKLNSFKEKKVENNV